MERPSIVFKTEAGNLPDNRVNFVREDENGRIWIGTKRGLALVVNGEVKIVNRSLHFVSLLANGNTVYFLTENGDIYSYQEEARELVKQAAISSVAGKTSLTDDFRIKDKWVILTTAGVYNYDLITYTLTPDPHLNIKKGEVIRDNHGDYWIYNHTGRVHYMLAATGETKSFQLIPEEKLDHIDFERYHIVHDSRGIIWISTYGNGLFAYNTAEDKLEHFAAGITENSYINSDFLLFVMEDRAGGIWVSSEYSGVARISVLNEGTSRIYPENPELFDRSNAIRTIGEMPNGDIGITTRKGGLFTYDTHFNQKMNKTYFQSNIYAVEKDADGKLWMGTRGEGLKIGNDWYRHDKLDLATLSNNNIFAICRDAKDRMWIGTFGGGLDLAETTPDGTPWCSPPPTP